MPSVGSIRKWKILSSVMAFDVRIVLTIILTSQYATYGTSRFFAFLLRKTKKESLAPFQKKPEIKKNIGIWNAWMYFEKSSEICRWPSIIRIMPIPRYRSIYSTRYPPSLTSFQFPNLYSCHTESSSSNFSDLEFFSTCLQIKSFSNSNAYSPGILQGFFSENTFYLLPLLLK